MWIAWNYMANSFDNNYNCELFYFRNYGCSVLLCRQSKLNLVLIIVWLNQQLASLQSSMDSDGRIPNNNQAVLPENSCRFYCNRGFWWFSQPGLLSMQLQRQHCPKLLLHFEAKFFGDFHSHGCYQSPSVSYTRGAGKDSQHKNSSPERW